MHFIEILLLAMIPIIQRFHLDFNYIPADSTFGAKKAWWIRVYPWPIVYESDYIFSAKKGTSSQVTTVADLYYGTVRCSPFCTGRRRYRWMHLLPSLSIAVATLHLLIEGYRWQIVPAYFPSVLLASFTFNNVKRLIRSSEKSTPVGRKWLRIPISVLPRLLGWNSEEYRSDGRISMSSKIKYGYRSEGLGSYPNVPHADLCTR